MKTGRTIITSLCGLAAAILAVYLVLERQAWTQLNRANNTLRQRLSQTRELLAENQRLSNLVARANAPPSRPGPAPDPAAEEREKEIVRLRGEVAALRQQNQEIETLRADTRQLRAGREAALKTLNASPSDSSSGAATASGLELEILSAGYWTEKTNLDVTAELRDRVRRGSLKAIASNNLKGDPEYGQAKHLTVVYRFGGVTATNEFREGDFVVLPKE